jgi:hypothetical protein
VTPTARARTLPLWPAVVGGLVALVWWNAQPFREGGLHIRVKDLAFLPAPTLGRALCLGQCGSASKLRWIDSFSYFELQLDRRDDRLPGTGESAFKRLYDLLIALDPKWEIFYQHAAFNTEALTHRDDYALGFLLRGTTEIPHATALWRQLAAELYVNYQLEETHPEQMDSFLDQWAADEPTYDGKRLVWQWKLAMGRRRYHGIEQIGYWQDQLEAAQPGSPTAQFLERTMREQLTRYALGELRALADGWGRRHGYPPLTAHELLDLAVLGERYPDGQLPQWGPVALDEHGEPILRPDPYGFPFVLGSFQPTSVGLVRQLAENRLGALDVDITTLAVQKKRWPETLAQAQAMGLDLPPLPPGGTYRLAGHEVRIDWEQPPSAPWPLRSAR